MAESMQGLKRTHRCGELSSANIGEKVTVMGWYRRTEIKAESYLWICVTAPESFRSYLREKNRQS